MPEDPAAESELRHALSAYEREKSSLLESIREARMEARRVSIEASSCKQPIPQTVIDRWQTQIKESAAALAGVERQIGEINKALRALRNASQPIKTLSRLPCDIAVKAEPIEAKPNGNGVINIQPKEGRVLFLEFLCQLIHENIDPRLVEVLERDAHSLVDQYRATHGKEK
jgi:hypothetical protein